MKFKYNKFGWVVISWMENGYRKEMKFDTVSSAKNFYKKLKSRGLI